MAALDEKDITPVCHFSYCLGRNCTYLVQLSTPTREETFLLMNRLNVSLIVTALKVLTLHCSYEQGQLLSRQKRGSGYWHALRTAALCWHLWV